MREKWIDKESLWVFTSYDFIPNLFKNQKNRDLLKNLSNCF